MAAQVIDASQINPDLLPGSLRDLVDIVGLSAALEIAQAYSGLSLYIPVNPNPSSDLAKLIGITALEKLCVRYPGVDVDIPKIDKALMQIKHRLVAQMKQQNISDRQIARELNYTERRVRQLKVLAQSNNLDLFE